eukprot:CAMPEP_0117559426 /NCGR_PEP_ID=MMETSP0784-20121206/53358_1 /TAXON_ID=39447 /ORGANISM="" /LENGTH=243 /DNA_ID=CAMNT_0005356811 /DNA_START=58 /DNA_END=788 /DNA_ORIENTATION=-
MDYDSGFSGLPMKPPHLGILPSDVKVRPASHVLFDNSPLPDSVPAYSTLVGDSAAVTASNPRATLSNSRGGPIHVADIALRAPAAPVAQLNNNAEVDEAPGVNGDEVVCPYDPRLNVYNGGFRTGPGSVTTSQASALQAASPEQSPEAYKPSAEDVRRAATDLRPELPENADQESTAIWLQRKQCEPSVEPPHVIPPGEPTCFRRVPHVAETLASRRARRGKGARDAHRQEFAETEPRAALRT